MKKDTNKKSLIPCFESIFMTDGEMIPENGEDSLFFSVNDRLGIISVYDGCGGLGSRKYAEYQNKSGAYIASRVTAKAVMDWFNAFSQRSDSNISGNTIQEVCEELKTRIVSELSDYNKSTHVAAIKGSLTKSFPTTASIILFKRFNKTIRSYYIWAGDSRGYILTTEGLSQVTKDDIENEADALDNLSSDGKLSNVISAEGDFVLHYKMGPSEDAAILITSTDGCFGYFATPMEFEYMLLDTLQSASSIEDWNNKLKAYIMRYTADDYTIGFVVYGYKNFEKLQKAYKARYEELKKNYIAPLQNADEATKAKLWNAYKEHYYGSVISDRH